MEAMTYWSEKGERDLKMRRPAIKPVNMGANSEPGINTLGENLHDVYDKVTSVPPTQVLLRQLLQK